MAKSALVTLRNVSLALFPSLALFAACTIGHDDGASASTEPPVAASANDVALGDVTDDTVGVDDGATTVPAAPDATVAQDPPATPPTDDAKADDAAPAEPKQDEPAKTDDAKPATPAATPAADQTVTQEAEERWKIKQQQMQMQVEETYAEGQRLFEAGKYAEAKQRFEQALYQIQWSPLSVDWGTLKERAQAGLENADRAAARKDAETRHEQEKTAFDKLRDEEMAEQSRQKEMVLQMLDDAIVAFNRNDFTEAEHIANEILKRDPKNDRAERLRKDAIASQRDDFNSKAVDLRKQEFRRWKQEIEETRIPYSKILTGPDDARWKQISALRTRESVLSLENSDNATTKALKEKIANTRVASITIAEVSLPDAANAINIITGIPIVVDPEVKTELESSSVQLNMGTLNDISVASLLNLITQQAGEGIVWKVMNGVVYITKAEKAQDKGVPRIHSVQDLTFALTDFKGPRIGKIPLPNQEASEEEGSVFGSDQAGEQVVQPEEITNLIKENIARGSWESGKYSVDVANNSQILVIHTSEVQLQVAQFLDDLRRFASSVVTIESRFVTITDGFLQEIGVDWRGLGPTVGTEAFLNDVTNGLEDNAGQAQDNGGPGLSSGAGLAPIAGAFFNDGSDGDVRAFTNNFFESALGKVLTPTGGAALQVAILHGDSEYNAVVRAVEKSVNATTISSPNITVYNTERAYVTVTNQVSFVQDFDVDVANSAFIANPNIGIIQEGVVLDVRPTISYDRKFITLEIQATVANLLRPIRTYTTSLAGFSVPVTFQLPELQTQSAFTTVRVPDQGSLILGGLKRLNYVNRTAEVPWLGRIPLLGVLFRQKGLDDETRNLIIICKATITNLNPWRDTPKGG